MRRAVGVGGLVLAAALGASGCEGCDPNRAARAAERRQAACAALDQELTPGCASDPLESLCERALDCVGPDDEVRIRCCDR